MLGDNDYLKRRADELGLDRGDILEQIQAVVDGWYPGQVRALSLNGGILRLITPNASVASDLRLRQVELLAKLGLSGKISRLQVMIGS